MAHAAGVGLPLAACLTAVLTKEWSTTGYVLSEQKESHCTPDAVSSMLDCMGPSPQPAPAHHTFIRQAPSGICVHHPSSSTPLSIPFVGSSQPLSQVPPNPDDEELTCQICHLADNVLQTDKRAQQTIKTRAILLNM